MKSKSKNKGITLIALVITVIVMLILVGVTISTAINGGLFEYAGKAVGEMQTAIDEEQRLADGWIKSENKWYESIDAYLAGEEYEEIDTSKVAIFDTGTNVIQKIWALDPDGIVPMPLFSDVYANLSIDGIKRYKGTIDASKKTEANIVSWSEGYSAYEQNPSAFTDIIPEGTTLCPIYMWFEESGKQEYRDFQGKKYEGNEYEETNDRKIVNTGTLYWWSESNNIYLNSDSSNMFAGMSYLSDLSGLSIVKADYVTNMSNMFYAVWGNRSLTNVNSFLKWNVSNVTNMSRLFLSCFELVDINGLKKWDVSNVKDMSGMFGDGVDIKLTPCALSDISPIAQWDVSSVENMEAMFGGCTLKNLNPLKNWNVSKVTNMKYMFATGDWTTLTDTSGINNWDVTSVTNFNGMFTGLDKSKYPTFTKVTGTWDDEGTFTKS